MTGIDNKKRISNIRLISFVIVILYTITIGLLSSFDLITSQMLFLLISCFLLGKFVLFNILNVTRIVFIPKEKEFILRYCSLGFKKIKFTSIELNNDAFSHFDILNKYNGLLTYIILYKKTINGLAKYQPVNISFLSQAETVSLLISLKNYMVMK